MLLLIIPIVLSFFLSLNQTPTAKADGVLGYDVIGTGAGVNDGWSSSFVVTKVNVTAGYNISQIGIYTYWSSTSNAMAVIFSDNSGVPQNLLANGSSTSINDEAWGVLPINYTVADTGVVWIGMYSQISRWVKADAGESGQTYVWGQGTYPAVPSTYSPTFGPTIENKKPSIYANYTYTPPELNVVLNAPADDVTVGSLTQTFTYTPTITTDSFQNATLFVNNVAVANNATTITNATTNNIEYTFPSAGTYNWSVRVFNSMTGMFPDANRTITVLMAPTYTPAFNADMKLTRDANLTKMANGTAVMFKGVNKVELADDPDGIWMGDTNWNETKVIQELDQMKTYGVNLVRVTFSIYDWKQNATDSHSSQPQPYVMRRLANLTAERGMWILFAAYRVGDYYNYTTQGSLPYPPYTNQTDVIANEADFVSFWGDVAADLKDYGNTMLEIWNEPDAGTSTAWFNVCRDWMVEVRSANYTMPLVVQWGMANWINLNYPTRAGGSYPMDWVDQANSTINDVSNNMIYSNHQYRNHIHWSTPDSFNAYSYEDINSGYTYMNLYNASNYYPIFMGEIGANIWWTGEDLAKELAFFNNSLSLLNSHNISYAGWTWRASGAGAYPLINSDLSAYDGSGEIFFAYTNEGDFTNTYTLELTITAPTNTTYSSSTVAYEVSSSGNDTVPTYQINAYKLGVPVGDNQTAVSGSFTGLSNGTYVFAVRVVGFNGASDYEEVIFTYQVVTGDATPTPTATSTTAGTVTANLLVSLAIFGVVPVAIGGAVFLMVLRRPGDGNEATDMNEVVPAIIVAVVCIILVEICMVITVSVIAAFP